MKKYITPKTIGDIIFPIISPNLIHPAFKGVKNFEFNRPSIKKIIEIKIDQILMSSPCLRGQKAIIAKTIKNIIPKLLFELLFSILSFLILVFFLFYPLTTLCFCSPNLSIPRVSSSPPFKNLGGFMFSPTPLGVPVQQISPGYNVMQWLI